MHRLPSSSAVRRMRIASLLLGTKCLLVPAAIGLFIWSFATANRDLAVTGLAMLLTAGVMVVVQWIIAMRATCPLCMTPVLGTKDCVKHRSARTLFGSHRLRVAFAVLCLNRFRCPYCGESSVLEVRARRPR